MFTKSQKYDIILKVSKIVLGYNIIRRFRKIMDKLDQYWRDNYNNIISFVDSSDPQYIADLIYNGDIDKFIQNTGKQVALDLLYQLGIETLEDEMNNSYEVLEESNKIKWRCYEPDLEGIYSLDELKDIYNKEIDKYSQDGYSDFDSWLYDMEKLGIFVKEDKEKMEELKEKYIKTYTETDYGYHNNATMIYGELNDGNWYVYIPDNDVIDIYNEPITEKFIDTSYNYDTDDEKADDEWYNKFVEEHQITKNYNTDDLNLIISELDHKYFGEELIESKELNEAVFEIDYAGEGDLSTEEAIINNVKEWLGDLSDKVKVEVKEVKGPGAGWPEIRLIGDKELIGTFLNKEYNSGADSLEDTYDLYLLKEFNELLDKDFEKLEEDSKEVKKEFTCIEDRQGGTWAVGNTMTAEEWGETASTWAESDNWEDPEEPLLKNFDSEEDCIAFIDDLWEITIVPSTDPRAKKFLDKANNEVKTEDLKEIKYNIYILEGGDGVYNSQLIDTVDSEEQAEDRVAELSAETGSNAYYKKVINGKEEDEDEWDSLEEEKEREITYNEEDNKKLKEIYDNLQNNINYGYDMTNVTFPVFHSVLYLVWNDIAHTEKAIGWNHYGSSANKNTLEDLKWVLDNIFEMTPTKFLNTYIKEQDSKIEESKELKTELEDYPDSFNYLGDDPDDEEEPFSGIEFEKKIPHTMRFKQYDVLDDTKDLELYWVTQQFFSETELNEFIKALKKTIFKKAYVTVRDLSTYQFDKDLENNVLVKIELNAISDLPYVDATRYIEAIKNNYNFDYKTGEWKP